MPSQLDYFAELGLPRISKYFSLAKQGADSLPGLLGEASKGALAPIEFLLNAAETLTKVKEPEKLGEIAITLAYEQTAIQALKAVAKPKERIPLALTKGEIQDRIDKAHLVDREDLLGFSLEQPFLHPFMQRADRGFYALVRSGGYNEAEWRAIQGRFRDRFVANLRSILNHTDLGERFQPFKDWLGEGTEEYAARMTLDLHAQRQRAKFEEAPVFGIEPFSLSQIYVETDCGRLKGRQVRTPSQFGTATATRDDDRLDPFNEDSGGRSPLLGAVLHLIGDKKLDQAIVIQGPAGCGKSTFTRRLSVRLLEEGLRPIRVRIRDLALNVPLLEDIQQAILNDRDTDPAKEPLPKPERLFLDGKLFDDAVQFGDAQICRYVVILDGWDEVSSTDATFNVLIERMLRRVKEDLLRRNHPKVRVILTGRPTEAVGADLLDAKTPILTIRPYTREQLEEYLDRLCKAVEDPVADSTSEWRPRDRESYSEVVEKYAARKKDLEIMGLPLLAHLAVMVMSTHEGNLTDLVSSPTTLYRRLTDLTINGGKALNDPDGADELALLKGQDLRRWLHHTAVAATAYGSENVPYDEMKRRLEWLTGQAELLDTANAVGENHPLSRLMVSFYFRSGHTHLGCEFLHKSFREYLFAEAVVEILKDYARDLDETPPERPESEARRDFDSGDPRRKLTRDLGWTLAPRWLSPDVRYYLNSLLQWEIERATTVEPAEPTTLKPLDLEGWGRVRDALAEVWEWWGAGAHLRTRKWRGHRNKEEEALPFVLELAEWGSQLATDPSKQYYPRVVTPDGYLGDALSGLTAQLHYSCALAACSAGQPRRFQSRSLDKEHYLRFLPGGTGTTSGLRYLPQYFARIHAVGSRPLGSYPSWATLIGVDLSGADLSGAPLLGVDLREADLRGAHLSGADLSGAVLTGADLSGADLSGAVLYEADLSGTHLRRADLSRARLFGVDLSGADLSAADLSAAGLTEADLSGADLSDANLSGAVLSDANLSDACLNTVRGLDTADTTGVIGLPANSASKAATSD